MSEREPIILHKHSFQQIITFLPKQAKTAACLRFRGNWDRSKITCISEAKISTKLGTDITTKIAKKHHFTLYQFLNKSEKCQTSLVFCFVVRKKGWLPKRIRPERVARRLISDIICSLTISREQTKTLFKKINIEGLMKITGAQWPRWSYHVVAHFQPKIIFEGPKLALCFYVTLWFFGHLW